MGQRDGKEMVSRLGLRWNWTVLLTEMWSMEREPGLCCFGTREGGRGQQESPWTCRALRCLVDVSDRTEFSKETWSCPLPGFQPFLLAYDPFDLARSFVNII